MAAVKEYRRFAEKPVLEAMVDTPVVVIQGARQVGKSTLVRHISDQLSSVRSFTLDDPATLAIAQSDPTFFVDQNPDGVLVIDEAQRAPEIILPIKASVDRDRRPGRFLLTGSADLLQVKGAGDSLAGRAETIELWPFSQGELGRRKSPEDFVTWILTRPELDDGAALTPETVTRGGYPEATTRTPSRALRWFNSYITRLADHDARELTGGGFPDHLATMMRIIAASSQGELVKAKLAREIGISETAFSSYLRLAVDMRLVHKLPSWGRTPCGRITRRQKVGLNDTGLAAALSAFSPTQSSTVGGHEQYGNLVEQFVALELAKQRTWSQETFDLYHFRHLDGLEVDLVIELHDGRLIAIEVKSTTSPTKRSWSNLVRFRQVFPDRQVIGVCLHTGRTAARIDGWLDVLPISRLWDH